MNEASKALKLNSYNLIRNCAYKNAYISHDEKNDMHVYTFSDDSKLYEISESFSDVPEII